MSHIEAKKIIVIGEAKAGKSTLLNALLGIDLLPADVLQCTQKIIQLDYAEDYSIEIILSNEKSIHLQGIEAVRSTVSSVGAVNEYYRGLPINVLDDFLYDNQGKFEEPKILKLLTSIRNKNYLNYPIAEYKEKVRAYLSENKKHWDKKVTMLKIKVPFSDTTFRDVSFIDTPGLGAEGDLGNITHEYIGEADALLLVKSITGTAAESSNFKSLVDQTVTNYPNKPLLLAFTRSANMNEQQVEEVINHTSKVYPNIMPGCIVAVDSIAQRYLKSFESMEYDQIKQTLMLDAQSGNVENFVFSALMKSKSKEQFVRELKQLSNVGLLKNRIFQLLFWDSDYELPYQDYMITPSPRTYEEFYSKTVEIYDSFIEKVQITWIKDVIQPTKVFFESLSHDVKLIKGVISLKEFLIELGKLYCRCISILKSTYTSLLSNIKDTAVLNNEITSLKLDLAEAIFKRDNASILKKVFLFTVPLAGIVDNTTLFLRVQEYQKKLAVLQNEQIENEKAIHFCEECPSIVFKMKLEIEKVEHLIQQLKFYENITEFE